MTTRILHGYERDGEINESTICRTPKLAEQAARVYCVNAVKDKPDEHATHGISAWDHLINTGRLKPVEIYCRIVPVRKRVKVR